jgi:hypothetical protein
MTSSVVKTSPKLWKTVENPMLWSSMKRAALASLTITTRKSSIMASRADVSQHMLVSMPTITTLVIPAAVNFSGRSERDGMNALKRDLVAMISPGCTSSVG